MSPVEFRPLIITALESKGWTRYRLAQETGISNARIGEYLSGQREITSYNLELILDALNLDVKPIKKPKK